MCLRVFPCRETCRCFAEATIGPISTRDFVLSTDDPWRSTRKSHVAVFTTGTPFTPRSVFPTGPTPISSCCRATREPRSIFRPDVSISISWRWKPSSTSCPTCLSTSKVNSTISAGTLPSWRGIAGNISRAMNCSSHWVRGRSSEKARSWRSDPYSQFAWAIPSGSSPYRRQHLRAEHEDDEKDRVNPGRRKKHRDLNRRSSARACPPRGPRRQDAKYGKHRKKHRDGDSGGRNIASAGGIHNPLVPHNISRESK